jgi:uncharacterized membrane protein YiaA
MMTKKKILIGSIFAALLMVSMPLISALQTQHVATSKTTISVQPSNPTATITAADIANMNSISSLANDLYASLSNNPGTVTPEQMIKILKLTKLLRTVMNDLGYTDGDITQLSIKALKDKGYTVDAASFNQKLQAVLNLNPESISISLMEWGSIICDVVFVAGVMCYAIGLFGAPLALLITWPIAFPLLLIGTVLLFLYQKNGCSPSTGCNLCAGSTEPIAHMTSN